MEKILETEIEENLRTGEKKYLTVTYKKLPTIISLTLHGVIMRINTISKGDDLSVDYVNILNKKPLSQQKSFAPFQGGQVSISKFKQMIDTIRPSRLVEIFIFRISEFEWRFNIRKNPFYTRF